jgi:hypothetical protein
VGRGPLGVCCRVSVDRDCWSYYQTDSAVVILEKVTVILKTFSSFLSHCSSYRPKRAQTQFQVHCFSSRKIPVSTAPASERHRQAVFDLVKITATFDVAPRDVRYIVLYFKELSSGAACCESVDKRLVGYLFVQV